MQQNNMSAHTQKEIAHTECRRVLACMWKVNAN